MNIESILRRLPRGTSPAISLRGLFALVSLSLGLIVWLGIATCQRRVDSYQLAAKERLALLSQHPQLRNQLQALQQQVEQTRTECDRLVSRLPSTPSESEFLALLSESAEQFGVTVGDFRPGSVQVKQPAREMELRLRATGSYAGLCRWLDAVNQLPRMLHIDHLTFVGPAASGGDCTVDLQLMLVFGFTDKVH